jgi:hypothetical protein
LEQFLAIVDRNRGTGSIEPRPALGSAIRLADEEMARIFPESAAPRSIRRWTDRAGTMSICHWTNEGRHPDDTPERSGLFVLGSHTITSRDREVLSTSTGRLEDKVRAVGGCLTVVIGDDVSVRIAGTVVPATPLYLGSNADFWVVSSRAHVVAAICNDLTKYPLGMYSLIQAGFITGSNTPYRNVTCLPLGTMIDISPERMWSDSTWDLEAGEGDSGPDAISALADALVDAVRPLQNLEGPVSLALSGGRDSRLIAAALHSAGIDFRAVTRGEPGDPDVVLAIEVAERLRIMHEVAPRDSVVTESTRLIENPWSRAVRVADITEAATSAWDDISDRGSWLGSTVLSGIGGEVLRGGYAYSLSEVSRNRAWDKIRNLFNGRSLLTGAAIEAADEAIGWWRDRLDQDFAGMLDDLYLHERLGRWGVARKSAVTRRRFFGPFLDNRVIRAALAIPPLIRWSEQPLAELIEQLAPQLSNLPLEGRPWRYLKTDTTPRTANRAPADWRRLDDERIRDQVRGVLLRPDGPGAEDFFRLVERGKLVSALHQDTVRPSKLWHMLTARAFFALDTPGTSQEEKLMTLEIAQP